MQKSQFHDILLCRKQIPIYDTEQYIILSKKTFRMYPIYVRVLEREANNIAFFHQEAP